MTSIDTIAYNALGAFEELQEIKPEERYKFFEILKIQLTLIQSFVIDLAQQETGLMIDELAAEYSRALYQIEQYSQMLLDNSFGSDKKHSENLLLEYHPIGPVVIFGASNFPFAYSTVGGDVISALVAGCSVIFKAHEGHPKTSNCMYNALKKAITEAGMPSDIYQHVYAPDYQYAQNLIQHSIVKAVGFTGSQKVGRILFDMCQKRPDPIPFFGELGSLNPVYVLKNYWHDNEDIFRQQYIESFTGRNGQVCTHPSILCLPENAKTAYFIKNITCYLEKYSFRKLLTDNIVKQFKKGYAYLCDHYQKIGDYQVINDKNYVKPTLFLISYQEFIHDKNLQDEIFGPIGFIIKYDNYDALHDIAKCVSGQLTSSIFGSKDDYHSIMNIEKIVRHKTGRIIFNQMPTGVQVHDAMQHGGSYPASTCPHFTAVGRRAVFRFVYPTAYQNKPAFL